jgi:ABC-type multidrug transport system ATPase subunit
MGEVQVEARGVRKRFRGREVLDGVDLEVRAGEVLGLIGPNGGGKSTLLLAMAGLIRPDAGTLLIGGTPAHKVALTSLGTVGLITAVPGLYPLLSGWENLAFFGALYGLPEPVCRSRVHSLAEELDLLAHLDDRVAAYSSGMQQKVSVLRALLMDPPVLLLDEPTANLDPLSAEIIHSTARRHADRGRCVIWVTHDLYAAEQICDRVCLISRHVLHTEVLDGPRAVPARSRLLEQWRAVLGAT